jgi:cytochrome d ubiquinol oxidase subunit I
VGPVAAPGVAVSLIAFVVVYTVVFGGGILFLLHLFRQTPQAHDPGPAADAPVRSAGITAAPALTSRSDRFGGGAAVDPVE